VVVLCFGEPDLRCVNGIGFGCASMSLIAAMGNR
jgi:hypothetical protein